MPADQWDDLIVAVLVGLTVVGAAAAALIKVLLGIRDDVRDARSLAAATQTMAAATHESMQVDNGNGSLRAAINRIESRQEAADVRMTAMESEQRETRRDVGGMRSDVRALQDRDAEDRETSRIEHGRLWQAIRRGGPAEFED